ncbi:MULTISPECIES: PH domain-containing protein [Dyadobacter]|uniref:PH domain-containing protein n=1 Tax=Dyadobacter chenhuakuii TaxID=2909339 RepID=A0ABY4XN12_9BACT|nr:MULTISPECIES: PH domain-containing protein [Dyadobacter]MCE7070656.1 PH domain-containing protein [Dyadobacter sp. CY327]MCF2495144.1 PH domain-containing protein [Dyadobacter chenhuakuii]USJ31545.1 PH domain-containing protein [Dyadobacter chenhuakuii]
MTYKTSWDTLAKIVTAAVTALYIGIFLQVFLGDGEISQGSTYVIGVILILSYGLAFAFRPVDYRVTPNELIIRRSFDKVVIERSNIAKVEALDSDRLRWSLRTFGVGGLFGYFGKYYHHKIGNMTWYATRRNNAVLIKTVKGKNIIITPDQVDAFVDEFQIAGNVLS